MALLFLDLDQVVRLHRSLIEHYGGTEGVRDLGLLHAAIAMPQAAYGGQYLHPDLFVMAGAYLFHLVQDHPFLDGNKRTGAASAIVFLTMNDVTIDTDQPGLVDLTLRVATGQATKARAAKFFRTHVR